MKKLVLRSDIVDAMSDASMQSVQGGNDDKLIINTSTRPIQPTIRTDPTTVNPTVLYTKGSCPTCMTC